MSDDEDADFDDDFDDDDAFSYEDEDFVTAAPAGEGGGSAKPPWDSFGIDELKVRQEDLIHEVEELCGVPTPSAEVLLRRYKWQLSDATESFFADPDKALAKAGVPADVDGAESSSGRGYCPACMEEFDAGELDALICGHRYCRDCWTGYLESQVRDGSTSLHAKCPAPKCDLAVGRNWFEQYCTPEPLAKFQSYLLRDFVESNPNARWCPFPNCSGAVLVKSSLARSEDVACKCGYQFCFSCGQEAHRPIGCKLVQKWAEKNADEAENMTWILANTKPCPKCGHPIEKNQGCMHMVCRCKHQFCWICLADDFNYSHTRDGRPCNKFKEEEADSETQDVRKNLARYSFFFERYKSHERAQEVCQEKTLVQVEEAMKKLHNHIGDWMDVTFLEEATRQVLNCRRILKWSYAYGYFAPFDPQRKEYFEYQQGELEKKVDQLQELSEKTDLASFADDTSNKRFFDFKAELVNLTKVVANFFKSLSAVFEEWQDEDEDEAKEKTARENAGAGPDSAKRARHAEESEGPMEA
jgi:ariadne-1